MNSTYRGLNLQKSLKRIHLSRGFLFGILILAALLFFEMFNFSTTQFALQDLLGQFEFSGVLWATILAIAFCGIDFAGIARLFTPEQGNDEPAEVWYLFGAWFLAAIMNAMLTWWGVSIAILSHETLGNAVVERSMLIKIVPIFVAIIVLLVRVLIIGTFSVAGEKLFSQADKFTQNRFKINSNNFNHQTMSNQRAITPQTAPTFRPAPKSSNPINPERGYNRPEPTYHPVSMTGQNSQNLPRR